MQLLNTSSHSNSTTVLGSLFSRLTIFPEKKFFLISNLNLPYLSIQEPHQHLLNCDWGHPTLTATPDFLTSSTYGFPQQSLNHPYPYNDLILVQQPNNKITAQAGASKEGSWVMQPLGFYLLTVTRATGAPCDPEAIPSLSSRAPTQSSAALSASLSTCCTLTQCPLGTSYLEKSSTPTCL